MRYKSHVRNKAQPEGSIAEGYIADECLTFCSRYLNNIETVFNRPQRNYEVENIENYLFSSGGRFIGKARISTLDLNAYAQMHRYVLLHTPMIEPYKRYQLLLNVSIF